MPKVPPPFQGSNQFTPQQKMPSTSQKATSALPRSVVSQRHRPDRPPRWLTQLHEPSGGKRNQPALIPSKSSSAIGAKAARRERESGNVEKPRGTEVKKLRWSGKLRNSVLLRNIKGAILRKKSKPDISADSKKMEADGSVFTPAQIKEVRTYQKNLGVRERQTYLNEFKRWTRPKRELMIAYIRNEKVEDRLEQAIDKNKKVLSAGASLSGKLSRVLNFTNRRDWKKSKHLAELSRDQWRKKLHKEQGEPKVTLDDIIGVMATPGHQEKFFDYAVRMGKVDPAIVFKKGLDQLEEKYQNRKGNEEREKAALRERQAKKTPDPYAISDDDSDSNKKSGNGRAAARSTNNPRPMPSFDSAQAEYGSTEERLR